MQTETPASANAPRADDCRYLFLLGYCVKFGGAHMGQIVPFLCDNEGTVVFDLDLALIGIKPESSDRVLAGFPVAGAILVEAPQKSDLLWFHHLCHL